MSELIQRISDRYGNRLLEFMERYQLTCLMQAQEWQLLEFIEQEGL